jgi:hypothetical protein
MSALVERVHARVGQRLNYPESGSRTLDPGRFTGYRQNFEPPCRVFYRFDGTRVFILFIMRTERLLRPGRLSKRASGAES